MKIRDLISAMLAVVCAVSLTACSGNSGNSSSAPASEVTDSSSDVSASANSGEAADMVKNAPATDGNVKDVTIQTGDIVAEFEVEGFGTMKAKLFPDIAPIGVQNFIELAQSGYYEGKNIHRVMSDFMMQGGSLNGDGTGGEAAYSGEGNSSGSFGIETDSNARHFYGALCYANAGGMNTTQFYIVNSKQAQDLGEATPEQMAEAAESAKAMKEQYAAGSDEYIYYEQLEQEYRKLVDTVEDIISKYKNGGAAFLDGGYTVFGQVVEGFDVIDSIAAVEVKDNGYGEESKPVKDIIIKSVKVYTAE